MVSKYNLYEVQVFTCPSTNLLNLFYSEKTVIQVPPDMNRRIFFFLVSISWIEATFIEIAQSIFGGANNALLSQQNEAYKVYWNVPTFMCHRYDMKFEEISEKFGIEQNHDDSFRGGKMAILYDPGMFPALLKHPNGSIQIRNGGVPQEGSLKKHLNLFKIHLEEQIVDKSFSGIGVIDFESWRPIYRQNWAALRPYKDYSLRLEHKKHPFWNEAQLEREAAQKFEVAGRVFMEETLKLAKALRPHASWSYYAFPYCFNLTPHQQTPQCDVKVHDENNHMAWLWELEDMLLPSVYQKIGLSTDAKNGLIAGRLNEAKRLAKKTKHPKKVLPYFWYKYQDQRDIFLSKDDIVNGFREMINRGANGHIMWGSSKDFTSKEKCQQFRSYLNEVLGPAVIEAIGHAKQIESNENGNLLEATEENTGNDISHTEQINMNIKK